MHPVCIYLSKGYNRAMRKKVFTGDVPVVFAVGDLHGDYQSFKRVLARFDKEGKDALLLFLGDYADRGSQGVEIITELDRLLDRRQDIVALKGNHEQYQDGMPIFSPCDLIHEAREKYGSWERFYDEVFAGFVDKLHIAAVINHVLFIHAGVSSGIQSVEDLAKADNEQVLLWSDPSPYPGEHFNIRGAGITFGKDVTEKVLASLGLRMMVRSHEPRKAADGPYAEHGGKVITTNACASYGEPWKRFMLKVDTLSLKYQPVYL